MSVSCLFSMPYPAGFQGKRRPVFPSKWLRSGLFVEARQLSQQQDFLTLGRANRRPHIVSERRSPVATWQSGVFPVAPALRNRRMCICRVNPCWGCWRRLGPDQRARRRIQRYRCESDTYRSLVDPRGQCLVIDLIDI